MIWAFLFLILWILAGIWYFIINLGNAKTGGPEPWYAWPLVLPLFPIALILGFILKCIYSKDKE